MNVTTGLRFYFVFIVAALLAVVALHRYLKRKLGGTHDNSLLWLAGSFLIWLLVIQLELRIASNPEGANEELFLSIFRRFLSVFNSMCLVLFLSFFREGWHWLNLRIKKLTATPEKTALGLLFVCIAAALVDETSWLRVETAMSVLVALLLTVSFTLSFINRKIPFMLPLALGGGLLLVLNQLAILAQDSAHDRQVAALWPPDETMVLRRILALFILMLNIGALATTWLGENSTPGEPEQGDVTAGTETPDQEPAKRLEFREADGHVVVCLSFTKGDVSVRDLSFNDRELNPAKRGLLFKHAVATREGRFVKSSIFNNFSKERGELMRELNKKLQPLGMELAAEDLFAKGPDSGTYRLAFAPGNIHIDPQVAHLI